MRLALGLEYDGASFHGWQSQRSLRTVQGVLETALSHVADSSIHVQCAGRTDTGVHATGQVVHFDTNVHRSVRAWVYGTNAKLPKDVSVRWVKTVDDSFHARYSATGRHYRYFIYNHAIRPSLHQSHVSWHYRPLDHEKMATAAQSFLGEHDFSSFRAVGCQSKTPYRRITEFTIVRRSDMIVIDIKANAFLHHMVRNLVGVLLDIGTGRQPVSWATHVLESRDRNIGGVTAPPYGLYLVNVDYPTQFALPSSGNGPLFLLQEER